MISTSSRLTWPVLVFVVLLTASASGQWSANPAQNLPIADRSNEQVQPKIRSTSDGGCYISWFDNYSGGYDVRLQRLDPRGYEQWPHNGILIANRSFSSTQDYGLDVDAEDNAAIAYRDDRTGAVQISANKIDPGGTLLWGPVGVQVSVTPNAGTSPHIAATSDGGYVVGWSEGTGFKLQKLDANGAAQWVAGGIAVVPGTGTYMLSDLVGSDAGTVIALWVYRTGGMYSPIHLYSQKYSPAGDTLWGAAPVIIYDGGSVQNGYFPTFLSDEAGGAIYGWYENSGSRNCYVQHVSAAGTELFAHNGVAASTLGNRIRLTPSVAFAPGSGDIFLFWVESDSTQTHWGLYGQRFSSAGVRQWTNNARELIALSDRQISFVEALTFGTDALVFCFDQAGAAHVLGMRVDSAGHFVWAGSPVQVCSVASSKMRLDVRSTPSGMALVAWGDGRTDAGDIYAQNVNPAGTFGLPAFILGDLNCDGRVDNFDITPFVLVLTSTPPGYPEYYAVYPTCNHMHGDINGDGAVNNFDISPFVELLVGP